MSFKIIDGVRDKFEFLKIAKEIGNIYQQTDDTQHSGIATLKFNSEIHKYGFSKEKLIPHTDRSNMQQPPDTILLWYERPAERGGESLIFNAEKHLLPVIDKINFQACFGSENDKNCIAKDLYDVNQNIFRFRDDDYIYLKNRNYERFIEVRKIIENHTEEIVLQKDQCLTVDNHHTFHGRKAFEGNRIMNRILVYKHKCWRNKDSDKKHSI